MKRTWSGLSGTLAALLLLQTPGLRAQEPARADVTVPRQHFELEFRIPDSLMLRWNPELAWEGEPQEEAAWQLQHVAPMSSVVVILREHLPVGTMILQNNTLRLGRHWILSNGQAEDWAPLPAGYLDARTLSLPLP